MHRQEPPSKVPRLSALMDPRLSAPHGPQVICLLWTPCYLPPPPIAPMLSANHGLQVKYHDLKCQYHHHNIHYDCKCASELHKHVLFVYNYNYTSIWAVGSKDTRWNMPWTITDKYILFSFSFSFSCVVFWVVVAVQHRSRRLHRRRLFPPT